MCSGQASALPNTHPTLTATLVVPPTGSPSLLPPTTSRNQSLTISSTRTTMRTTTRTRNSSTTATPSSSSVSTTMVTSSLVTSTTTSATTSAPISTSTSESSTAKVLAPAQIAGISVGVSGAVALAVGAILLARCLRRRRYSDSDSEKTFYTNGSNRGTPDPLISRGSHIFHISPPILRMSRYRPDFIPRPAPQTPQAAQAEPRRNPENVDRSTIGLAISRPRSMIPPRKPTPQLHSPVPPSPRPVEAPIERRASRLLPPRPSLTVEIPSKTVVTGAPSSQAPPTTDRASTLTNMTAFADLDAEAAESGQVWRPPSTDPLSATTLYVADRYGNWVLSNDHRRSQIAQVTKAAELDTYTPLTKSPIERREEAAAKRTAAISASTALPGQPQPAFLSQDPKSWTYSQASSLYSQASAVRQSGRRSSSGRNSSSKSRKVSGGHGVDRCDSKASTTTIQTSSTGMNGGRISYDNDIARLSQLSPVEESPDPAYKRTQVTYPKIPGRLDGATIRSVPPPKRPNFSGSPSGQPSPTLGAVFPVHDSPSAYPPPLNPRRSQRPYAPHQRTGSGFTPEPPNYEVFPLRDSTARTIETSNSGWNQWTGDRVATHPYRPVNPPQFRTPTQPSVPTFTPSPPSPSRPLPTPPQARDLINGQGRFHIASQHNTNSTTSSRTISSSTSSLLAKRLGSDRAAALVLDKKASQWRLQGGGLLSPDFASPRGTLPQTPTWQPKLTPTRRGDDLYLNVQ